MAPFIVFEGGEGSGKSTQTRHLYGILCQQHHRARMLREPGGTSLGEALRSLISVPRQALAGTWRHMLAPPQPNTQLVAQEIWSPITPSAELFLFLAARAQLVEEIIRPSLARGISVICDRYIYSTLAYQGCGRGLDLEFLEQVNQLATQGLEPDLVVLLDIEPTQGLERKRRSGDLSRFEEEEISFHRRVREGYLKLAQRDPERWLVVDASLPRRVVAQKVWERVKGLIPSLQDSYP